MSQDKGDASPGKVTAPIPDSPVSHRSIYTNRDDASSMDEATQKMADEIKSGRSPYDFRGEIEEKRSFFAHFPFAGVVFVFALLFLAVTSFFGYNKYTSMSGQFEGMATEITALSEQLRVLRDAGDWTSKSTVRAELQKTLVALTQVIALGEVEATKKALRLREEINAILIELEKEIIEDDVHSAPTIDPGSGLTQPSGQSSIGEALHEPDGGLDIGGSDSILEKDPIQAIFGKSDKG